MRRAVLKIQAAPELPRIEALAAELHASQRNLRRVFHEVVGMTPKAYARIVRFQHALRAARETRAQLDWSEIASRTGYYDQSHLIADFRALTGSTPGALRLG